MCWFDKIKVAIFLLLSLIVVGCSDEKFQSAMTFHYVLSKGEFDNIRCLLQRNPELANATTNEFCPSPLHKVAYSGKTDITELLIEYGAEVNAQEKWGATPLHVAAIQGDKEIVNILVRHGASVNANSLLLCTPLFQAAQYGHLEIVQILLNNGADVNAANYDGASAIHIAAEKGHDEIISILMAKGAPINARDHKGRTPLLYALWNGQAKTAEWLRINGGVE
jgi:ankyrin repeat protein